MISLILNKNIKGKIILHVGGNTWYIEYVFLEMLIKTTR